MQYLIHVMKELLIALSIVAISAPAVRADIMDIFNTVDQVNRTINRTRDTIDYSRRSIESLSDTLGVTFDASNYNENDPVASAMAVYQDWYEILDYEKKEAVHYLVIEYAQGNLTDFRTFSTSEWFTSKPPQNQAEAASLYMKLSNILNVAQQDQTRFLAFAFCVNAGGVQCQ